MVTRPSNRRLQDRSPIFLRRLGSDIENTARALRFLRLSLLGRLRFLAQRLLAALRGQEVAEHVKWGQGCAKIFVEIFVLYYELRVGG